MPNLAENLREINRRWNDLPRRAALVAASFAGLWLCGKMIRFVLPFLIAAAMAAFLVRPARALEKAAARIHIKGAIVDVLFVLVVYAALSFLIYAVGVRAGSELVDLSESLPDMLKEAGDRLTSLLASFSAHFGKNVSDTLSSALSSAASRAASWVGNAALSMVNVLLALPRVVLFAVVMIMGTAYFLIDRARLRAFGLKWTPPFVLTRGAQLRRTAFLGLAGQIKSALIMMTFTSIELIIGFSLLRFPYAVALGLLIGIMDVLPIIGAGTFLLPMSAYFLVTGDIRLGLFMLLLYGIVVGMRQIVEPRVVGYQLGLHPLEVLAAMYVGLVGVGVAGVFIGPVFYLFLKALLATEDPKPYQKKPRRILRKKRQGV